MPLSITTDDLAVSTITYKSKITQREEHLPFVLGVMGVPGELASSFSSSVIDTNHRKRCEDDGRPIDQFTEHGPADFGPYWQRHVYATR